MIQKKSLTILLLMALNVIATSGPAQPVAGPAQEAVAMANPRIVPTDWPQWRGRNRDGVVQTAGLLETWPEAGPKEIWRKKIGDGYAGILVVGDRLITAYSSDGFEMLLCIDANSGDEIWRFRLNRDFEESHGNGPRSTPAVDNGVVFALGSRGLLSAVSLETGKQLWQVDIHLKVGDGKDDLGRGYVTSPLVEGDLVILHAGREPGKNIVAIDKNSGAVVWTSQTGVLPYSSAIAITMDGVRQIINFVPAGLISLTPAGQELWSYPWETKFGQNIAAPIFHPPDKIFISSDRREGSAMLRIAHAGETWQVQKVWRNKKFKNKFHSSILVDGHIYGFHGSILKCLSAATGEEKWKVRDASGIDEKFGRGTLIAAGDKLFILGEKGVLALVRANGESYSELASVRLFDDDRCWTMPTLANGKLYLRNREQILCLRVAK